MLAVAGIPSKFTDGAGMSRPACRPVVDWTAASPAKLRPAEAKTALRVAFAVRDDP